LKAIYMCKICLYLCTAVAVIRFHIYGLCKNTHSKSSYVNYFDWSSEPPKQYNSDDTPRNELKVTFIKTAVIYNSFRNDQNLAQVSDSGINLCMLSNLTKLYIFRSIMLLRLRMAFTGHLFVVEVLHIS
jgi:hypothetical protein